MSDRSAHAQRHEPFYLEENKRLKTQVAEMEQFLADYGLIWVGTNPEESDSDIEEIDQSDQPNWDVIIENVRELNLLGGEGRSKIEKLTDGPHRLVEKVRNIKLTIYSNGIMLGEGPFRSLKHCQHFLNDIADGYFPRFLKKFFWVNLQLLSNNTCKVFMFNGTLKIRVFIDICWICLKTLIAQI